MIGQRENLKMIRNWQMKQSTPHTIMLVGENGSGRTTLAKVIGKSLQADILIAENTVEAVRDIIDKANTLTAKIVYIFRDMDSMSPQAKNALLKVLEEPTDNTYFILTANNTMNVLNTIVSRSVVVRMEPYKLSDLMSVTRDPDILSVARTVGEVEYWEEQGTIKEFLKDVSEFLRGLTSLLGVEQLAFVHKLFSGDNPYPVKTFLNTVLVKAHSDFDFSKEELKQMLNITLSTYAKLSVSSAKVDAIIDTYVLSLREVLK